MNTEVLYARFNGRHKVLIYLNTIVELKVTNELEWNSFPC